MEKTGGAARNRMTQATGNKAKASDLTLDVNNVIH